MNKKFLIKIFILICIAITVCLFILNIPIFKVNTQSVDQYKQNTNFDEMNNICILKYTYTTGPGWAVEDTEIEQLIDQNVCLSCLFDPRLLKDNNDFELDYLSRLIVSIDTIDKIIMDNEKVYVIKPKKITILCDTKKMNTK